MGIERAGARAAAELRALRGTARRRTRCAPSGRGADAGTARFTGSMLVSAPHSWLAAPSSAFLHLVPAGGSTSLSDSHFCTLSHFHSGYPQCFCHLIILHSWGHEAWLPLGGFAVLQCIKCGGGQEGPRPHDAEPVSDLKPFAHSGPVAPHVPLVRSTQVGVFGADSCIGASWPASRVSIRKPEWRDFLSQSWGSGLSDTRWSALHLIATLTRRLGSGERNCPGSSALPGSYLRGRRASG